MNSHASAVRLELKKDQCSGISIRHYHDVRVLTPVRRLLEVKVTHLRRRYSEDPLTNSLRENLNTCFIPVYVFVFEIMISAVVFLTFRNETNTLMVYRNL